MRGARKRKIIHVDKNTEELAQDNLFEISYLTDDRYVDQSQILQLKINEPRYSEPGPSQSPHTKNTIIHHQESKPKRTIYSTPRKNNYQRTAKTQSQKKDKELLIHNKLYSNSVFVGINNLIAGSTQQGNCMLIKPKKRLETCPNLNSKGDSFARKKLTETLERTSSNPKKTFSANWRIKKQHKERLESLKDQMRATLFFRSSVS